MKTCKNSYMWIFRTLDNAFTVLSQFMKFPDEVSSLGWRSLIHFCSFEEKILVKCCEKSDSFGS